MYVDRGVDGACLKHTVKALQQEIDLNFYTFRRLDAKNLLAESWSEKAALVVFPGGQDIYYHVALDGMGTTKIRRFVERGGAYLGICAGAYFGSSDIEFENGGSYEVCQKRSLSFFPGVAIGPAYGKDKYRAGSLQGLEAAHISWKDSSFYAYFNGGCQFVGNFSGVEVLSSYLELEGDPAAVVACRVGQGKAVLSGVHLEYQASSLVRNNPYVEKVYHLLEKGEPQRRSVFRDLLSHLNIAIR